jgi:dipeptide/tripeptide permease
VVQNLLGASTAPIIMGKIYDLTNIQTALSILPVVLLIGTLLFWLGSRHYSNDLGKVAKIELHAV